MRHAEARAYIACAGERGARCGHGRGYECARRDRGPPAQPPPGEVGAGPRERRVVVDEYAQEFAREDDACGSEQAWDAAEPAEFEQRAWDWGA